MLSGICFKQIKDNFWLGQYGDFQVIMMQDCSYVNATKLCKDDGRRFDNWLANDTSKRLIKALESHLGHEAPDSTMAAMFKGSSSRDLAAGILTAPSKAL